MSGTHEHDEPARHSMVLFGDSGLYLMHMAGFTKAHNDQVVIEVGLSKDGAAPEDVYREDRRTSGAKMYSVKPEDMVLSELKEGVSFTGEMHRGNFEAEEDLLVDEVTVTVNRVVHLQQLDPNTKTDPAAGRRYLCFGLPGELFAVHEITGAPNFDQLIPINIDDPDFAQLSFAEATPLRLPGNDDEDSKLGDDEATEAHFPEATGPSGQKGIRTRIVAGREMFFDPSFLQ